MEIKEDGSITILNKNENQLKTLIFIHGFNQTPFDFLKSFLKSPVQDSLRNFKIVMPCAPVRFMKLTNLNTNSWYNWKINLQTDHKFEDCFEVSEVYESI